MRALVVYESMYGNTRAVAGNIADGLRADYEVTVVPVAEATAELVAGADLLVAGAPTHMHGLSSTSSRQMAAEAAAKDGSELRLDPDAGGPGMHGWLKDLGHGDGLATAFDTRINGVPRVHRPGQPPHRQAAEAARLPPRRRPGELPGQLAEHAARRRSRPGPPVGHDHRRGEQDVPAGARLRSAIPISHISTRIAEVSLVDDFFKIVAAAPAFFVSAWLLMLLWLTLAPAMGAIARTGKGKGKKC